MANTTKPNAILLARLSDNREEIDLTDEGIPLALDDQIGQMLHTCERLGWNPWKTIKNPRLSAYTRKMVALPDGRRAYRVFRPDLREALEDLSAGRATRLLCLDLDRAFRDPLDLRDLIDTVDHAAHSIVVESVNGSLHMEKGRDNFDAEIRVLVAHKSSRDTGRRVSAARARRAQEGLFGGGRRPYGFEKDGITPVDAEYRVIQNAAADYLNRVSLRSIARDLTVAGVPCAARATKWSASTLRAILIRPRNISKTENIKAREAAKENPNATWLDRLGVVGDAPWPPILTDEVYRAVLAKVEANTGRGKLGPGRAARWLLSGLARCVCGDVMEVHNRERFGRTPVYRCRTMTPGAGCTTCPVAGLDQFVTALVIDRLSRDDALDLVGQPNTEVDTDALRLEIRSLRQRKSDLAEVFAAGQIDAVQLGTASTALQARLTDAEGALMSALDLSPLTPLVGAEDIAALWETLPLGVRRSVIKHLYKITVLPATRGRPRGRTAESTVAALDPKRVRVESVIAA